MTFLVLIIALSINYLWLLEFDRFDDGWFFRLRRRVAAATAGLSSSPRRRAAANLLAIYGLPLIVLGLLLALVDDRALGIPAMALHVLVLVIALDRIQPERLSKDFLGHWEAGDLEASRRYIETELGVPVEAAESDGDELAHFFNQQLLYRSFENMFMMYFWYIVIGPLGVALVYISYQLRDSQGSVQSLTESKWVATMISLLEWIPLRLLALTFSLAGNFERCFARLQENFWVFAPYFDAAGMLYDCARRALSGSGGEAQADLFAAAGEDRGPAAEIQAMRGLLERSQAIWLALLALVTIFDLL